jgi:hypothetical protein
MPRSDTPSGVYIGPADSLLRRRIAAPARLAGPVRLVQAFLGIGKRYRPLDPRPVPSSWGWIPVMSLTSALGLIAITVGLGPNTPAHIPGVLFLNAGFLLLLVPLTLRLVWPSVSRFERIGLIVLAVVALYIIKLLPRPLGFIDFDEFLHWVTAADIIERKTLFSPNPLLPISPLYPALEIITAAVVNITGWSILVSATLLLAILRVVFVLALFLLFETITASSRLAALGCLVYMGNSAFFIFHAAFAYESLAIVFIALAFLAAARAEHNVANRWTYLVFLAVPFLAALSATHHIAAFIAIFILISLVVLVFLNQLAPQYRMAVVALVSAAALSSIGWLTMMGDPVLEYLGPPLQEGLTTLYHLLTTLTQARRPFLSDDGSAAPLWQQLAMLSSLLLVCLGLATGFFRTLSLAGMRVTRGRGRMPIVVTWTNNWAVLAAVITIGFPITLALRLTGSGWEIGNRLCPYFYFGVAPVVAVAVAGAWQGHSKSLARTLGVGAAMTLLLIGGLFAAWGGPIEVPLHYRVVADALSVEPMGIAAAQWTKKWLGPDNNIAADRINRLLMATYGRQRVITLLEDDIDLSSAFFAERLGPEELNALKVGAIDYMVVDMRMTKAMPRMGIYFERGEADDIHAAPPDPAALLKFNRVPQVSRLFDNGYIMIYDVADLVTTLLHEH